MYTYSQRGTRSASGGTVVGIGEHTFLNWFKGSYAYLVEGHFDWWQDDSKMIPHRARSGTNLGCRLSCNSIILPVNYVKFLCNYTWT